MDKQLIRDIQLDLNEKRRLKILWRRLSEHNIECMMWDSVVPMSDKNDLEYVKKNINLKNIVWEYGDKHYDIDFFYCYGANGENETELMKKLEKEENNE